MNKILLTLSLGVGMGNLYSQQYTTNHDVWIIDIPMDSLWNEVNSLQSILFEEKTPYDTSSIKTKKIQKIKEYSEFTYYKNLWELHKKESSKEK